MIWIQPSGPLCLWQCLFNFLLLQQTITTSSDMRLCIISGISFWGTFGNYLLREIPQTVQTREIEQSGQSWQSGQTWETWLIFVQGSFCKSCDVIHFVNHQEIQQNERAQVERATRHPTDRSDSSSHILQGAHHFKEYVPFDVFLRLDLTSTDIEIFRWPMQHLQDARFYHVISYEAKMVPYSEVALVGRKECGFDCSVGHTQGHFTL